jgi:predicted RND superfamily exporter protein
LLERRSGTFLLLIVVLTALLAAPMVLMPPDGGASDNPGGRVYELQERVNTLLPPRTHSPFYIVEALESDSGSRDVLTQPVLLELFENANRLRAADASGGLAPPGIDPRPLLYSSFDTDLLRPIVGIFTIADAVDAVLREHPLLATSLVDATEDQVKFAIDFVLSGERTEALGDFLSQLAASRPGTALGQPIDWWTSPGMVFNVIADNELLGGGGLNIGATTDPVTQGKEQFNRDVQTILRGEQRTYGLWGVAIDAGLEIEDEVATAVPFIMATFLVVLVVVGISLRSVPVVGLTALGIIFMIVWLKGLSNLVGLRSSTTLDFIVPIAMISLGADFAIHAVHRYREEHRMALDPRIALRLAMGGVFTALALAMLTDAVAFLANVTASTETVIGFGIGAGLAIVAAFVILGLAVPVALMRFDLLCASRSQPDADEGASLAATGAPEDERLEDSRPSPANSRLASTVVTLARRRMLVLPVAAVVTAVSAYFAFQLEATFDVEDFFKSDSDFAVSLNKVDLHIGDSGGEPAVFYIEGDLADPSAVAAVNDFYEGLSSDAYVAKNDDGEATFNTRPLFAILEQTIRSDYALDQIQAASGVPMRFEANALREFTYSDRAYRWPASREQLEAIFDYVSVNGVPLSPTQIVYDAGEVGETLFHDPSGARPDATTLVVGIPGTRSQSAVTNSRETLGRAVDALRQHPAITDAGLTGSPYTRQAGLDATTEGLQMAFLIAVAACLVIAVVAMRSVRYGVVTIIPITLVVAWLYAFMYAFGFGLNFITATIAAISVGVGIDYAIHMTQRYREELRRAGGDAEVALGHAAQGTGTALIASAATSILGFAVMAFAPMPMFASYGILTSVMIFLATVASLGVLPSLLMLVTPRPAPRS